MTSQEPVASSDPASFGTSPTQADSPETALDRRFVIAIAGLAVGAAASATASILLSVTDGLIMLVLTVMIAITVELYGAIVGTGTTLRRTIEDTSEHFAHAVALQKHFDRDEAVGRKVTALLASYETIATERIDSAFTDQAEASLDRCVSGLARLAAGNMPIDKVGGLFHLMDRLRSPTLQSCCAVSNSRVWEGQAGLNYNRLNIERAKAGVDITRVFIEDFPLDRDVYRTVIAQHAAGVHVLVANRAEVPSELQRGFALFDGRIVVALDEVERAGGRGDDGWSMGISNETSGVRAARDAFEKLRTLAMDLSRDTPSIRIEHHLSEGPVGRVARIRSALLAGLRNHFEMEDVLEVRAPILVNWTGSCETVSTVISLPCLGGLVLTQTGQLTLESALHLSPAVWCHTGSFRHETCDERHLQEFELLEEEFSDAHVEWATGDRPRDGEEMLRVLIGRISAAVKAMVAEALARCPSEIADLGGDLDALTRMLSEEFDCLCYREALQVMAAADSPAKPFGTDLDGGDEALLMASRTPDALHRPLFVTHYPQTIKFFNMRVSAEDPEVVYSVDLLLPGVGEAVGGAVREDNAEVLAERFNRLMRPRLEEVDSSGAAAESFAAYLQDVKAGGANLHAGYGIGLERVLQYVIQGQDVRRTNLPLLLGEDCGGAAAG